MSSGRATSAQFSSVIDIAQHLALWLLLDP